MAKWRAFAKAAEDLLDAARSAAARVRDIDGLDEQTFNALDRKVIDAVDNFDPGDIPAALTVIRGTGGATPRMSRAQMNAIIPNVRELADKALAASRPYRDADGKVVGVYGASTEMVKKVTENFGNLINVQRNKIMQALPEGTGTASAEDVQKMAKKLRDDITAATEGKKPAPNVNQGEIEDAFKYWDIMGKLRAQNPEAFEMLESTNEFTRDGLRRAAEARLRQSKSREDLRKRWFDLPLGMRQLAEAGGENSSLMRVGREVKNKFETVNPMEKGPGGASPLARRPQAEPPPAEPPEELDLPGLWELMEDGDDL